MNTEACSDARYVGDEGDWKETSRYLTYVDGNLITWHSRKQRVVSRSSADAE